MRSFPQHFHLFSLSILLLCFAGFVNVGSGQTAPAPATTAEEIGKIYQESMVAFQKGDYATTTAGLEKVIAATAAGPQLEPVYFSLGAAYFNTGDYSRAIETFHKYQTLYPQGAHRSEIAFSMGKARMESKQYAEAITSFKELESLPQFHEEALLQEATALKESGKVDEATAMLEKLLEPGINSQSTAMAAIQLAGYYSEKKDAPKAIEVLNKVRTKLALMDNLLRLNALAIELGDNFLSASQTTEALACYSVVQPPPAVVKFQENRVRNLQAQYDANLATIRAEPTKMSQLLAANVQLKSDLQDAGKLVEQARAMPDFTPALYLRIAQAFYQQDKKWQAVVAYEEILQRFPTAPEQEAALFGATVASAEAGRAEASKSYCEQYLKAYPSNPNAQTVGYLLGQTALQIGDAQGAETYFGRILTEQPKSQYREEMIFLVGNARFGLGKFPEAGESYAAYLKEFPAGKHVEEVVYRTGMAKLFAGKYEEALGLLQGYQAKYPTGTFAADVSYRVDVCKYSASLYDEVIADSKAWEGKYPSDPMLGEVLALKADALAATSKNDEATAEYIRSYKAATTDEVLNYSLFAAQKLLQKKGDWPGISHLFEEFVASHPEHPTMVSALYWIGKAKAREGKVEEARTFTSDTIKKFIDDPKKDAVEQLLTQLAQLCLKRPVQVSVAAAGSVEASASPSPSPSSSPTPTPALPPYDSQTVLLGLLGEGKTPTAQARILFAQAELARLKKKSPEEQTALQAIADGFKPEDLSSVLLAQIGDFLLGKGKLDQAAVLFQKLMDGYPKSDYADFAWNGLGEIAYQRQEYPKALGYFTDAVNKVGATTKLKDVTVGQGKTLLALGKLDEARKIFEQVASIRDWRGEATAFSIYSLGAIAQQKGQLPEAIAFYQRVYISYQRYLTWVAKSYLSSAECFEKLGKKQEAANTYQEMLRQEKLATFPEITTARTRLKALTPG